MLPTVIQTEEALRTIPFKVKIERDFVNENETTANEAHLVRPLHYEMKYL